MSNKTHKEIFQDCEFQVPDGYRIIKLKFRPSIFERRLEGESMDDFNKRILAPEFKVVITDANTGIETVVTLLPDQRHTLELESKPSPFDKYVKGVWIEQAPLPIYEKRAIKK
jgi:hypothetical protein